MTSGFERVLWGGYSRLSFAGRCDSPAADFFSISFLEGGGGGRDLNFFPFFFFWGGGGGWVSVRPRTRLTLPLC